jgi:hypothetical protein
MVTIDQYAEAATGIESISGTSPFQLVVIGKQTYRKGAAMS